MNIPLSQQQIRTVRQLITNDIAYYIQYQKRGGSSGGMMQNDEYQLFIDNNNALVYAANNQIVDGMASDYALKIEPNGLLTIKNLKVINFDFVAQINQLINQVNLLQQSIGTTEQDITDIKNDIDTINQELLRQIHFSGYYLLNTDIQNLPNSANGDFAFSAESGTVWMFDQNWYNSGDIVPDQVTPASDATPLSDGTATAGISTEYSRGDHVHPLNITSTIPISDSASGSVGTANYYARSDHSHPQNITTTIPPQDSASGSVGTTNYYARNDHSHPINVETNASNIPIVDSVGTNGTSTFYARQDHVHPQQLTYDGNVTATKFIKAGGTANDILLADGSTKKSAITGKSFQVIDPEQYVKLCTILVINSTTDNSIEFKVSTRTGFGQLQFNQHWVNGYGIDKYQYLFIPILATGINIAWILYFNDGVDRYGELWCKIDYYSYNTYSYATELNAFQGNITNILTTDSQSALPTNYSSIKQLFPNTYGSIQINPTVTSYDDGLRISRSATETGNSSIQLGCSRTSNTGVIAGQWVIFTPSNTTQINPYGLVLAVASQTGDNTRGLQISANGNTLTFNGNGLVDLTTDQTLSGIKTFHKLLQVIPSSNGTFNEGIRISRHPSNQWSNIQFVSDPNSNSGKIDNQWLVGSTGNNGANPLGFVIVKAGEEGQANRGLQISADGNTLSFNGQVIAGGSVNYSQGNTILWGTNSLGTDRGFYSDGTTVFF
ncbi:MAG: hypothetical protein EZS28_018033 [Streblomastix strix]|uniref:Uncharacterized protein n=1 Tax=Streblomastix strix TaxID=222440 RepID=A0A5J4VVH3_9EUKA|nr:MAG: hypothetical protein EZS28_018033 [Streblomastix strix]